MGSIFGGSKSKQESGNKNIGVVTDAMAPNMGYVSQGGNLLASLLGGDASGFNAFKDAAGYDWNQERGMGNVMANQLVSGLGDSGSTLKRLAEFQSGLDNQFLGNYLSGAGGLADIGLGATGAVSGVGQYSRGSSKNSGGLGGLIGAGMSGLASGGFKF